MTTKNNFLLAVLAIFGLALVTSSCIEDEFEDIEIPISSEVLEAKAWFESNESSFWDAGSENARITSKEIRKKVNWDRAKTYDQADGKKVIEVQLDYQDLIVPEHLIGPSFSEETILHTLILFPKPNGNYVPYFLKVYSDDPEKKFKLADFVAGGYQKIPADFSGTYLFHKWNEKLIGGWRIKDGKKVKRIKPSKKNKQKKNKQNFRIAGDVVCYEITHTEYQVTCQEGFGCSDPEITDIYYTYECEYVGSPPSPNLDLGGWGGGGGGTLPDSGPCEVPDGNILDLPVDCEEEKSDAQDVIDYIQNELNKLLKPCEKDLILSNPIYAFQAIQVYLNKIIAENKTIEIFGYNGWNDCSDAFRHAYWNALMTKTIGVTGSALFATAHECVSGNPDLENLMDLFNNQKGRSLALNNLNLSDFDLAIIVLNSLQNGDLMLISNLAPNGSFSSNSELINSSSCQN
jgi:hypothetical protein